MTRVVINQAANRLAESKRRSPRSLVAARVRALGIVGAVCALALLFGAAGARADLKSEYAVFNDCPVDDPTVSLCIVSTVSSGEFVIGSKTVPINRTVVLQGGVPKTTLSTLVPAADGETLSKTPLQLPGGLVGLEVLPPLTEVTATAEQAGPIQLDLENALAGQGLAVSLPLKVKLDNPSLGNACYIGSGTEPVVLNLTTGTTSPPAPNQPISGAPGHTSPFAGRGKIATATGTSLVDNAFAAPGVNGCGGILSLVVDPAVDLDAGLPAPAGHNTAIMNGEVVLTEPNFVKAEAALPEIGRCVKAEKSKVNKEVRYHGGYTFPDCIEENSLHSGEFEWLPGAGPKNKFSGSGGAMKLETVAHAKVRCSAVSNSGEYTGRKTATVTLHLTGCELTGKGICHSVGAAAGEIVTGPLAGELGFIRDEFKEATAFTSVGLDLKHDPSVLSAECGTAKVQLSVTGSVIGAITPFDKMASAFTLKFAQSAGKQIPEHFEGGVNDTLVASFGSGSEAAGLAGADKFANEEPLAIKAEME
jgi:hypothetical protein